MSFKEFSFAFLPSDTYFASMLHKRKTNKRNPLYKRDDCFEAQTQVEHKQLWRVHFKVEVATESIRQRLQRQPCFNLYEAFNSCDLNDDGALTNDEIKKMILSRGFPVSDKEVSQVTDKFDSAKTGRISYAQVS